MILLSLSDVAHHLRVPLSTVRRWVAEGRLVKHGSKPYKVDYEKAEELATRRATRTLDNRAE